MKEGEVTDICVQLALLNNETILTHDVAFTVILATLPGASKTHF